LGSPGENPNNQCPQSTSHPVGYTTELARQLRIEQATGAKHLFH